MRKKLNYLFLTVLLLTGVFLSMGIFIPSLNYQSSITVNKPVEQSFKIFNSPFSLSEWMPGLKNVKWISGKQNEVGSKWEMTIEKDGNQYIMTEELIAFRENELFIVKMENEELTNEVEVRFAAKGAASEINSFNRVTGKNILRRSLLVFSQSIFAEQNKKMYEQLKKVIEASH